MFSGLFGFDFIFVCVICILLLAFDFWTVRYSLELGDGDSFTYPFTHPFTHPHASKRLCF